jgi:hypothetical protein
MPQALAYTACAFSTPAVSVVQSVIQAGFIHVNAVGNFDLC